MTAGKQIESVTIHPPMDRVKVGIIGYGRIGREHAGWLKECENIEPVAVADATPPRREFAKADGLVAHERIESLLNDQTINAVLISTPTAMHHQHALAAIAAGKHVMIEKPIALNLTQAKEIHHAATTAGIVASVFHNRRWDSDFLTVKNLIATRGLGKIINVESRLGQWSSCVGPAAKEWRPGWRNEAAYGGGGLFDWGSHFVDQIWRLLWPAKPVRVYAQLRGNVWSNDCDDFARIMIDFAGEAVALVEINTTTTRPLPRWHIDGTEGSAESPFSLEFDLKTWSQLTIARADGSAPRLAPVAKNGLTESAIWEEFAVAIQDRARPAVTLSSVLPTMALLDAARESAQRGAAVELPNDIAWVL